MRNDNARVPSDANTPPAPEPSSGSGRHLLRWLAWGALTLILGLAIFKWGLNRDTSKIQYETTEAQQGDLTVTVSATGNLQPTDQVDVGSEVSGTIATVEVDYNDVVKAGQVLARLDTTKLAAQANQSRAAVESARAGLLQVQASLEEARLELARLTQARQLSGGRIPSAQVFEAAEAALKRAQADEAANRSKIAEAEAKLQVDQTNLDKAVIISPINGVVLVRSVEPGQTVAASLQAPVLFTLAEDLAKMELHVDVDEADVGQVLTGQFATFTVDAYPERTFPARISQVRYGAKTVDGVVTYATLLAVDNSDLSLRPGMTATANITVQELHDALLVPNAALRFVPPAKTEGSNKNNRSDASVLSRLFPRPRRDPPVRKEINNKGSKRAQKVWVAREGNLVQVPVTVGASDGTSTEVLEGDLQPGQEVVVDSVAAKS